MKIRRPSSRLADKMALAPRPAAAIERVRDRRQWSRFARAVNVSPSHDLVQVGTAGEGYVVPGAMPRENWICYCAGLGEDVTFELDLIRRYGCDVHGFDPTPRSIAFVGPLAAANPRLHLHPVGLWSEDTEKIFWAPRHRSHVSHSIDNLQGTDSYFVAPCRRVSTLMRELSHDRVDLLKLDIEGAEYGVLNSLGEDGIRPRLILVEMHVIETIEGAIAGARALQARGYVPVHVDRAHVTWVFESDHAAMRRL
jgi:FkbM family methyltransferase